MWGIGVADPTPQELAEKLLAPSFTRRSPDGEAIADPIVDTPMIVTLEQLQTYDHDPRVTRNPRYEDIKSSIRERGLDAPPPITRRPGERHYIIRSGGNTRLSILRELWSETKDERFFRIACLFRPWSTRGEIIALTGHLAENELRGNLSFIERALGVAKANELYEQESGSALSQSELARRLTADGYPVAQSHISRMQDTVRYLLPAIPQILYGGLGRPQIERLATLRKNASRVWDNRAPANHVSIEFSALFQDVLASFDSEPAAFTVQRAQDELLGQMADILSSDYDTLALEIVDTEARHWVLTHEPTAPAALASTSAVTSAPPRATANAPSHIRLSAPVAGAAAFRPKAPTEGAQTQPTGEQNSSAHRETTSPAPQHSERTTTSQQDEDRIAQHILSPVEVSDRVNSIRETVAAATGDSLPDFRSNALQAIPVQAGGLYPISDVWYIDSGLDAIERLRVHIAQLAREIATEAAAADCIESLEQGVGFLVRDGSRAAPLAPSLTRAVLGLLSALSTPYAAHAARRSGGGSRLADDIGALLLGRAGATQSTTERSSRLSDVGLVKLFRLIRLARRLLELQTKDTQSVS